MKNNLAPTLWKFGQSAARPVRAAGGVGLKYPRGGRHARGLSKDQESAADLVARGASRFGGPFDAFVSVAAGNE